MEGTKNLTKFDTLIHEEKRLNSKDKTMDDIDISVCEKVGQLLVAIGDFPQVFSFPI